MGCRSAIQIYKVSHILTQPVIIHTNRCMYFEAKMRNKLLVSNIFDFRALSGLYGAWHLCSIVIYVTNQLLF